MDTNERRNSDFRDFLSEINRPESDVTWSQLLHKFDIKCSSIEIGSILCLCAIIMNFNYLYYDVFNDLNTIFIAKHNLFEIWAVLLWHIGGIFGCIICGMNQYTWQGGLSNLIIGLCLIFAGILICLHDLIWTKTVLLIAVAQFVAGCCYGFIYITTIVQTGDNIWRMIRGHVAVTLSSIILFAFLLSTVFKEHITDGPGQDRFDAITLIIMLLLIVIALLMNRRINYEPITWHLKLGKESDARNTFNQLYDSIVNSTEIDYEMNEKIEMMTEDYRETNDIVFIRIFTNGNWKPIVCNISLKILSLFTFNLFLLAISAVNIHEDQMSIIQIVLIFLRILSLFPAKFLIDRYGRKYFLLISGIGSSICSIPLSLHISNVIHINSIVLGISLLSFHIISSFGIQSIEHLYLIEAVPLSKRNGSIAFVTSIECIIHGFIMFLWLNNEISTLHLMIIIMPAVIITLTIALFVKITETKGKSLRQCRSEFNFFYKEL